MFRKNKVDSPQKTYKRRLHPFAPFKHEEEIDREDREMLLRMVESAVDLEEFTDFALRRRLLFGHSKTYRKPSNKPLIALNYKGIDVFDPQACMASVLKAFKFLSTNVSNKKKMIVVCNSFDRLTDKIVDFCEASGISYVHVRWVGGIITNSQSLNKRLFFAQNKKKDFEEKSILKSPVDSKVEKKINKALNEMKGLSRLKIGSNIAFVFCCEKSKAALHEFNVGKIKTVGVCDTNFDHTQVAYPILANDDHHLSINFCFNMLKTALEERKNAK